MKIMLTACTSRLRTTRLSCNITRLKMAIRINKSYLRNRFWIFVILAVKTLINRTKRKMMAIWDKKRVRRVIIVELEQTNLNFKTPIWRWEMTKKIISLKHRKSMLTTNNNWLMPNWALRRWLSEKKRHQRQQLTTCDIRKSKKMKKSWHITITA